MKQLAKNDFYPLSASMPRADCFWDRAGLSPKNLKKIDQRD